MDESKKYFAIAITRTCGSGGGSYIGKKLAADYGIDVYDRKLLRSMRLYLQMQMKTRKRPFYTVLQKESIAVKSSQRKAAIFYRTRTFLIIRQRFCRSFFIMNPMYASAGQQILS